MIWGQLHVDARDTRRANPAESSKKVIGTSSIDLSRQKLYTMDMYQIENHLDEHTTLTYAYTLIDRPHPQLHFSVQQILPITWNIQDD